MSQVLKLELQGCFIGDDPVREDFHDASIVCLLYDPQVEGLHPVNQ